MKYLNKGKTFEGDGDGQMCDATATRDRPDRPPNGRTDTLPDRENRQG